MISVRQREEVLFNIFQRSWVDAHLAENVAEKRRVLEWVRELVAKANRGMLKLKDLPVYSGSTRKYSAPSDHAYVETAELLGNDDKQFLAVDRAIKETGERPKDTIAIGVHFTGSPSPSENPIHAYRFLAAEIDRCNSLVAQEIFPPSGTTIKTIKPSDSHQLTYTWRTDDGWKVTVSPGGDFSFTNIPEKGL